jgi:6,7-dimethyl-8-ribityllumazine synthase
VCNESCRGLTLLGLEHEISIGNGILTCENKEQALERAKPSRKNKGKDVAEACLALIKIKNKFAK